MSAEEAYKPSQEEIDKGKDMMSPDETNGSKRREMIVNIHGAGIIGDTARRFEYQVEHGLRQFRADMNRMPVGLEDNIPPEFVGDVEEVKKLASEIGEKIARMGSLGEKYYKIHQNYLKEKGTKN